MTQATSHKQVVAGPEGRSETDSRVLVSVLVPVRNEELHLRNAVDAMLAQELDDGVAEFILVDGESEDATPAILEELSAHPQVRVLRNPHRTTPHALNIGLAAARGDYVARMDAHTLYPVRYLAIGIDRLATDRVAHVSGPQLARGDAGWSRTIALARQTVAGAGVARFRRDGSDPYEVDSGFRQVGEVDSAAAGGWSDEWSSIHDAELVARLRQEGGGFSACRKWQSPRCPETASTASRNSTSATGCTGPRPPAASRKRSVVPLRRPRSVWPCRRPLSPGRSSRHQRGPLHPTRCPPGRTDSPGLRVGADSFAFPSPSA